MTRFNVDPLRHNDYYLFFGTDNLHGLFEMKRAQWKVDRVGGRAYEQSAARAVGQGELFPVEEVTELPAAETLPVLLRHHVGNQTFTVEQAEFFTLTETRYLDQGHLRKLGLVPLQQAGLLQVTHSTRKRQTDFPKGTVMKLAG